MNRINSGSHSGRRIKVDEVKMPAVPLEWEEAWLSNVFVRVVRIDGAEATVAIHRQPHMRHDGIETTISVADLDVFHPPRRFTDGEDLTYTVTIVDPGDEVGDGLLYIADRRVWRLPEDSPVAKLSLLAEAWWDREWASIRIPRVHPMPLSLAFNHFQSLWLSPPPEEGSMLIQIDFTDVYSAVDADEAAKAVAEFVEAGLDDFSTSPIETWVASITPAAFLNESLERSSRPISRWTRVPGLEHY